MSDAETIVDANEGETLEVVMVLRERSADGVTGASIPLAAINNLAIVSLYDVATGTIVNDRDDGAPLVLIENAVVQATPGGTDLISWTYAIDPADGEWKLAIVFDPLDSDILDERLAYEMHRLRLTCVHTGGTFHPGLLIRVRNLEKIGAT